MNDILGLLPVTAARPPIAKEKRCELRFLPRLPFCFSPRDAWVTRNDDPLAFFQRVSTLGLLYQEKISLGGGKLDSLVSLRGG